MAIDEAIYRSSCSKCAPPTLRLYCWTKPSVSLGYFQNATDDIDLRACRMHDIDVVRRPTGGKAVFHGQDLTYSVVAKETNPLFPKNILGTYKVISQCIAKGLSSLGIKAAMSVEGRETADSLKAFCFSESSQYELLVQGKKICGSAQARSQGVFLQHGSLLLDFDPSQCNAILHSRLEPFRQMERLKSTITCVREHSPQDMSITALCDALRMGFETTLGIRFFEGDLTPSEEELRGCMLENKYMNQNWNLKGQVT